MTSSKCRCANPRTTLKSALLEALEAGKVVHPKTMGLLAVRTIGGVERLGAEVA